MSEEKKTVELKDEELEKVSGGQIPIGWSFGVAESYPRNYQGEWFVEAFEPDFIYNVCSSGNNNDSFIANRYWFNNGEAWPYGTRSFGERDTLYVASAPTIIHTDFTGTKPF